MSKKTKKAPTPSLCDTPPPEGNFLENLSLFNFLFPSWEGRRGGLYFALFSLSSDDAVWHERLSCKYGIE